MPPSKRRGARVLYVAQSARDLPDDVRDWLSRENNPATACRDPYEALAWLAVGRRPAVLIVSIDTVDWDELEFFALADRFGDKTRLYVAGREDQQDKIDAARDLGARVFSIAAVDQDLTAAPEEDEADAGPGGLLAGSLRSIEPPDQEPAETRPEQEPPPSVRLVMNTPADEEDETSVPLSVPWAPSPHRPKRTPPPRAADADATAETGKTDESEAAPESSRRGPVELTPEELAALLGRSGENDKSDSVREQRL